MADAVKKAQSSYQHYEDNYKKPLLPVWIVRLIAPVLIGRGSPPIEPQELWALAGVEAQHIPDAFADPARPAGASDPTPRLGEPNAHFADLPDEMFSRGSYPKDVLVYGTVQGGDNGVFELDMGHAIDYVRRPPGIASSRDVYAVYVEGISMIPARRPGELIYVHSMRPPAVGSDVVIQMKPHGEGEPVRCFIKRLVALRSEKIEVEQFNPAERFEIPRAAILRLHRILTLEELMGV